MQWVLSYVQGKLANIQKENIIKNLESESLSYIIVGEFLKEEFGKGNNETIKIAELKKIEQENKTMKKFVQKFKKAVV